MAENLPDLVARLRLDLSDAQAGVSRAAGIGGAIGGALGGTIANLAGNALASVKDFVTGSVGAFSQLEDGTAAAEVIFGDSMSKIIEQSRTAGGELGLASQQVIDAANTFGTYGKSAGLAGDDLAGFSTDMTSLAGDLASFKGTSTEQAIEAIGSALRGEAEPIRAYGVLLDDATLKARAMAEGIADGTSTLTPQQKVLAAQAEILAQTTDAQGDFERTMSSTANTQKRFEASTANLSAKFGTLLAPAFTAARERGIAMSEGISGALDTIIPKVDAFRDRFTVALDGIKALLIGGDYTGALRDAFGWEEDSGIVAGLLTIRDGVAGAVEGIRGVLGGIDFGGIFDSLLGAVGSVLPGVMAGLAPIGTAFGTLWASLGPLVPQLVAVVSALSPIGIVVRALLPVLPTLAAAFGGLVSTLLGAITPLLPVIAELAGMLVGALSQALVALAPAIVQIVTLLGGVLAQALAAVAPIFGMLPGIISSLLPPIFALIPALLSIVSAFLPLLPVIGQLIGALLPPLAQLIVAVVGPVAQLVGALVGALVPVLTLVAQLIAGLLVPVVKVLAAILGAVVPVVARVVGVIVGALVGALTAAIRWLGSIVSAVTRFFGTLGQGPAALGRLVSAVSSGISSVLTWFAGLPGRAVSALSSLGSSIASTGRSALSSLGTAVGNGITTVMTRLRALPGQAVNVLLGMVGRFRSAGSSIIGGLVDGIRNAIGRVTNAVGDVMAAARDLLPFSPAKRGPFSGRGWSLYSGRSITEALATGIRQRAGDAVGAMRDAAAAVAGVDVAPPALRSAVAASSNALAAGTGGPVTGANRVIGVRVFIGDRDITDIVRTEVDDALTDEADAIAVGAI